MTPDEVVARARELVGRDVLLTVKGVVQECGAYMIIALEDQGFGLGTEERPHPDLVDIQPAPLRIEAGQLYGTGDGRLFKGDAHGALWEMVDEVSMSVEELPGLHPVKVVPEEH